jgi:hypothetical protein
VIELLDSRLEGDAIVTRARSSRLICADTGDLREAIRREEFFRSIDEHIRRGRARPDLRASIPGNAYTVHTGASAVALTAATAKTVLYVNAAAANQPSFVELCVCFDGTTATNTPALLELVYGTKATNSTPGTGSTTFTPLQIRGWPSQVSAQAAANNCTSEPTVLTLIKPWLLSPNGGLLVIQFPLGREPTAIASGAATSGIQVGMRLTAPQGVNARAYFEYEE